MTTALSTQIKKPEFGRSGTGGLGAHTAAAASFPEADALSGAVSASHDAVFRAAHNYSGRVKGMSTTLTSVGSTYVQAGGEDKASAQQVQQVVNQGFGQGA
jgi:hypothetical protein